MGRFFSSFVLFFLVLFFSLILIGVGAGLSKFDPLDGSHIEKDSILVLKLDGLILNAEDFLDDLREYRDEDNIKGVLVQINSPGGVVGPSQEIYAELKRVREELQKPVVVTCSSLAASGAYYAAVAADRIVVNPGTLMGSIGVIMNFANLEKLYEWAKVDKFVISTGPYKDSGSESRPMRPDERELFQEMMDEVLEQFKTAVQEGRKMKREVLDKYADGRIFTGATAVQLGFADHVGTLVDGVRIVGELTGLGDDPNLFYPPQKKPDFLEVFSEMNPEGVWGKIFGKRNPLSLVGLPLYMMPGGFGGK